MSSRIIKLCLIGLIICAVGAAAFLYIRQMNDGEISDDCIFVDCMKWAEEWV